jgi:Zn-finger nucleic acid-binding protein
MSDSLRCPRCRVDLDVVATRGQTHHCPRCGGVALTVALLRQFAPEERIKRLWLASTDGEPGDPCPSCSRPLVVVPPYGERSTALDVCRPCQLIWFDAEKLKAFSPERQAPRRTGDHLSPRAAEALVRAQIESQRVADDVDRDAQKVEIAAELIRAVVAFLP